LQSVNHAAIVAVCSLKLVSCELGNRLRHTLVRITKLKHMYVFRSALSLYHGFVGNTLPPKINVPFSGASMVWSWAMSWRMAEHQSYGMRNHKLKTGTFWPLWT
jgi:hypothetical protein